MTERHSQCICAKILCLSLADSLLRCLLRLLHLLGALTSVQLQGCHSTTMFPFPPNLKAKIVHLCESSHSSLELCDSGQDLLSLLLAERNARTTPETFRNDDFGGGSKQCRGATGHTCHTDQYRSLERFMTFPPSLVKQRQ